MAVSYSTYATEIMYATMEYVAEKIEESNYYLDDPLHYEMIYKKGGIKKLKKGSYALKGNIQVDKMPFAWYNPRTYKSEGEQRNILDQYTYYWKYGKAENTWDGIELTQNAGPEQRNNLIKMKGNDLIKSVNEEITAAMYGLGVDGDITADPESMKPLGFQNFISRSLTVGGLTIASQPLWQPDAGAILATTAAALNYRKLSSVITNATDGRGSKTKMGFARPLALDLMRNMAYPNQQFAPDDKEWTNIGFQNVKINGVPFFPTRYVPDGFIFIVDTQYIDLIFDPTRAVTAGDTYRWNGQEKWTQEVNVMMSHQIRKRRYTCGMITGVTDAACNTLATA